MLPYMMLALVSGFVGVLFSPLHICLLLTNQFFATSLKQAYRFLWRPCLTLVLFSGLYFLLLTRFLCS